MCVTVVGVERAIPSLLAVALAAGCFVTSEDWTEAFDHDGDGYLHEEFHGNPDHPLVDCDDNNPDINPGAFESCIDDEDSDCDNDPCPAPVEYNLESDEAWARGENPGAGLRVTDAFGDLDGDGLPELVLSAAPEDAPGAVYLLKTPLTQTVVSLGELPVLRGEGPLWAHLAGDLDGDGDLELLVSERETREVKGKKNIGYLWLVDDGFSSGPVSALPDSLKITDEKDSDDDTPFGAIQRLGDWDSDGDDDFMVFSPGSPGEGDPGGAAYLILDGFSGETAITDVAHTKIQGLGAEGLGGRAGAAPDTDGDGRLELLLTAINADLPGSEDDGENAAEDIGAVYLFTGQLGAEVSSSDADVGIIGMYENAPLRYATSLGDINGDGNDDLGVYSESGPGDLYIFLGPLPGWRKPTDADIRLLGDAGETESQDFGSTVVAADINGDGNSDIVIAAPAEGAGGIEDLATPGAGAAYLFYGPVSGVNGPDHAAARWLGSEPHGELSTLLLADIDQEGTLDLLLGAPALEAEGETASHGQIHLQGDVYAAAPR